MRISLIVSGLAILFVGMIAIFIWQCCSPDYYPYGNKYTGMKFRELDSRIEHLESIWGMNR